MSASPASSMDSSLRAPCSGPIRTAPSRVAQSDARNRSSASNSAPTNDSGWGASSIGISATVSMPSRTLTCVTCWNDAASYSRFVNAPVGPTSRLRTGPSAPSSRAYRSAEENTLIGRPSSRSACSMGPHPPSGWRHRGSSVNTYTRVASPP